MAGTDVADGGGRGARGGAAAGAEREARLGRKARGAHRGPRQGDRRGAFHGRRQAARHAARAPAALAAPARARRLDLGAGVDSLWYINSGMPNRYEYATLPLAFSDIENLVGADGVDKFIFADGAAVAGNIDGGDGTNTLDFSGYTTGRAVTLTSTGTITGFAGTASGIGGTFDNIHILAGSSVTAASITTSTASEAAMATPYMYGRPVSIRPSTAMTTRRVIAARRRADL